MFSKISDDIQPLGFAAPFVPGGAPFSMCSLKCTRGKINSGGMLFPMALIEANIVAWPGCVFS